MAQSLAPLGPLSALYTNQVDVELLAFVERYATNLARWDILIFFGQNPTLVAGGRTIARGLGRRSESLKKELDDLAFLGVLQLHSNARGTGYELTREPALREAVIRLARQFHPPRAPDAPGGVAEASRATERRRRRAS
jgi:hypothetical protein